MKKNFRPNLGHNFPFLFFFLIEISALLNVRHCLKLDNRQYHAKLMMQPLENDKNPIFGPEFAPQYFSWVLPLLVVRQCFKPSFYSISTKTNEANLKK